MEGRKVEKTCKLKQTHIKYKKMGKTKLWHPWMPTWGDKPIKKFKKMLNGKVRTGISVQGGKVLGQEGQQRRNFLKPSSVS